MDVAFYTYNGEAKKINKTNDLTLLGSESGIKPFESFDVENGSLILAYNATYAEANYMKVNDYYYFVKTPILRVGERMIIELEKDVLMSNLVELLSMRVIMQRNSSMFNSYISDGRQVGQVNNTIFSIGMGEWSYGNGITVFASVGGKEIGSI